MSKREQNKLDNRLRLIRSAAQAFAVHGVKGANINLISTEAGLGKGTVYNYFPSKKELFQAVLNWAGGLLLPELKKIETGTGSAQGALKLMVAALLSFYRDRPDLAKLLIRSVAAHQVEHQQAVVAALNPLLERFQAALVHGIKRGEFRADLDPFISAVTLWGMVNHQTAFHWLVSSRALEPAGLVDLITVYFFNGIKAA